MEDLDTFTHITLLDRFKLECNLENLGKLKVIVNETDVIETCSGERKNLKWRFYKLPNLTVFAVVLKGLPMCSKDAVFPELLLTNCTINCVTLAKNTL